MNFKPEWTTVDKIDWLARRIIVASIIYYDMNENIISDKEYDEISRLLAAMIRENMEEAEKCYYWYVIYDFTGETGFHLKDRLTDVDDKYLSLIALNVLNASKRQW